MRRLFALFLLLTATACSGPGKTLFVVLPDENGKVGEVVVQGKNNKDQKVLNTAYAGSYANDDGALTATKLDQKAVTKTFGAALKAQPRLPASFILYFKPDSNVLVEGSQPELDKLFADLKLRDSYRVEVIGHTDRVGKDEYNATLSLRRAETIAQSLIKQGVPKARIIATGRGERDPLVATKDNVAEPKNRRVEVDVR